MKNKIDPKVFFDFKSQVADLRITNLTQDQIDQLKKQLDVIIKK